MKRYLLLYLATALVFLPLDFLFLGTLGKRVFTAQVGDMLGEVRLSCQILVNEDMAVRPLMTLRDSGLPDPGPEPAVEVTPEPEWRTA